MVTNDRIRLADAPQLQGALEGVLAIPTCCTPGCDEPTEPFTDRCPDCLERGDQ